MFIKGWKLLAILFLADGMLAPSLAKQALAASPGETVLVSVSSAGNPGLGDSWGPSVSADGRYVAFQSVAANLVPGDTNRLLDVFVRDTQTGTTLRASEDSSGGQGNGSSSESSISADGRYVAFASSATNLVPGDTNNFPDIFVHDMQTGQTRLVSVASSGIQANQPSYFPALSADGRYIAFETEAYNLVPGDEIYEENYSDIFVHDMQTGVTRRVSVTPGGDPANNHSYLGSISANGRYVAFRTTASNLVADDTNFYHDVFVYDMELGTTTRVSVAFDGSEADNSSGDSALSADGRYVAFSSEATNLVPGDTNAKGDIFVHDLLTGTTTRASVDSSGGQGDSNSFSPSISADGRYVAFNSDATNLASGDTNGETDIFVHGMQTGMTRLVSVNSSGEQTDNSVQSSVISADGQSVAFDADATNLVPEETHSGIDVFLHRLENISPATLYLSLANGQTVGGVSSADEDILYFDGVNWSLFVDGSDVGVQTPDLVAFSILDADTILMAFGSTVTVDGVAATPQDILRFDATSLGSDTAGTFSLYFDGSDVGLSNPTNEKIDALSLLPDGRLLISTVGSPNVSGLTTGQDEDVLAFTPTSLGAGTSGTWSLYFDGSDVGLADNNGEDVDALDVAAGNVYLSTLGSFSASGVAGEDEDVFVCAPTSLGDTTACTYSPSLYFDGSHWGLTGNDVDALDLLISTP